MSEPSPGDYRSFVGPADEYDVIGAAQFALLYALGLREEHRLLDIGCGSLRAGRMLIAYLAHLGRFRFVLAQGLATNTGPALLRRLLAAIDRTLAPDGLAAITAIHPGSSDGVATPVSIVDPGAPTWRYPDCLAYATGEFRQLITAAGLVGEPIDWFHPRHRWWLLARSRRALPPEDFLAALSGATLVTGWEASWPAQTPARQP